MFDDNTSYGLLKTLENNPSLSQRDLAKRLGISLGKVNFCPTLTALIGTSAWYGPGAAGCALVEAILRDEKKLFTCCVALDGEYGQKNICLGVPVIIGKNGCEKILDFKLSADEQAAFNKSADAVRGMNEVLKTL